MGQAIGDVSQSQTYGYQSAISAQNAIIAKQNAGYALMTGEHKAGQSGTATRYREGQIQAAQGASNLNVNTGTQAQVQQSQRLVGQEEQTAIRSSAAKTAYDYDVQSAQDTAQSQMYEQASTMSMIAAPISAAATILGMKSSFGPGGIGG